MMAVMMMMMMMMNALSENDVVRSSIYLNGSREDTLSHSPQRKGVALISVPLP